MKKILYIAILTLICSCNSDDNDNSIVETPAEDVNTIPTNYRLTKVEHFNSLTSTVPYATTFYEYDAELRIIRIKDESGNIKKQYNYEGDKIVSIENAVSTMYFTYNEQDLVISSSELRNGLLIEYEHEYNNLEQRVTYTQYLDGVFQCEINLSYDTANNVVLRENSCVSYNVAYEHDTMNHINMLLFSPQMRKYFGSASNNTTLTRLGSISQNQFFYEYNDQGFPSVINSPGDQEGVRYRQEYTYEFL